ncbi:hypothetical protein K443DRAFT_138728 [Laccaria amethystina LaAM-08-1]|uniref:Unplaced genomic scaffold K443scaffold_1, whole genome shotgun sequence n=1 Tax=Laccaria amethystina LaAM-08-1 TaxID=1095629 RepID=A0A0C9YIG4_9AGAR|nr:hypothetical protein K443DRAFT_138728 [Laccaria amethystina LaAM-08-1]
MRCIRGVLIFFRTHLRINVNQIAQVFVDNAGCCCDDHAVWNQKTFLGSKYTSLTFSEFICSIPTTRNRTSSLKALDSSECHLPNCLKGVILFASSRFFPIVHDCRGVHLLRFKNFRCKGAAMQGKNSVTIKQPPIISSRTRRRHFVFITNP